jgi:hypothetical protein
MIRQQRQNLHVCTVHQQYQSTFYFHNEAHNYKITGILKHLKFRHSLRHVSGHAGTTTVVLAKNKKWLPDDGSCMNRNTSK